MATRKVTVKNGFLHLQFFSQSRDEWFEILEGVKSLAVRQYDPDSKVWKVPVELADQVEELGFLLPKADSGELYTPMEESWRDTEIDLSRCEGLYPFQIDTLRFLIHRGGSGLIGDDMGTGKTVQALGFLRYFPELRPALIVVTAQTKRQWAVQTKKWLGRTPQVLSGRSPHRIASNIVILNWDILAPWERVLSSIAWDVVIADECQAIGNSKAKRTRAFVRIAKGVERVIFMSGTPVRTRPAQFFPILHVLNPSVFSSEWRYMHRYCGPRHTGFGMTFNGATNIEELHDLVAPLMIRRTKADVLKDLPSKTYNYIPIETRGHEIELSEETETMQLKAQVEALKNSAYALKRDGVIQWIREFLDSGENLLVFAYHRAVVFELQEAFRKESVVIMGGTSQAGRSEAIERFGKDKQLLIGNILATGVGIDGLQKVCSHACFVEFAWSPTDHSQAEDRLHRIGQEVPVTYHYLVGEGTIDEIFVDILSSRRGVIDQLLDGGSSEGFLGGIKERLKRGA